MSKKKSVDQTVDPETGELVDVTGDTSATPVFRRRARQYDLEDFIQRQTRRGYTGALQTVSSVPMEPPIGYVKRESVFEQMKAMVEARLDDLRREMEQGDELETLEEADDFEVGDPEDFHPSTPYEGNFDVSIKELLEAGNASLLAKKEEADKRARPAARTAPEPEKHSDPGAQAPSSSTSQRASPDV